MQKEILAEEQKCDEYKNETAKNYGSTPQLENKLANLLKEKKKSKIQQALLPPVNVRNSNNEMRLSENNKSVNDIMPNEKPSG